MKNRPIASHTPLREPRRGLGLFIPHSSFLTAFQIVTNYIC